MVSEPKSKAEIGSVGPEEKGSGPLPFLPKEFYLALLDLPPCKLTGKCTGCGKCG